MLAAYKRLLLEGAIKNSANILVLLLIFCSCSPQASAIESLSASGCSVSNVGYLNDLAKEYERLSGTMMFVRGGGSIVGLRDLRQGKIDYAASCQSKQADDPEDFEFTIASWDALVFIVHKSNPLNSITPQQVRDIYEGRITNWKQLGGPDLKIISFISSQEGMGGIGESLSKFILNGKRPAKQANSSMQASSVAIWEQLVERTPEGFASTGFGSSRKRDVKVLMVNGVAPTKANIISDKYPFRRPLFLVTKKNPKPEILKFIDFVLSRKGQALISSYGMPSLADVK
ncbi:MAG: phosphate ABC transporter substrate-binding protein [Nitrospirae bacterium]|nr:phosphate ABC transporter substrate-binding protein [Nitrospirota bacterium]